MFLTLYGEKFFPLNRAYHSYSQKIPAQMAGTCPWHSDLRCGKGHSQPPDYRTYSAEVTGSPPQSPASSQCSLARPMVVRPSQALLSYSIRLKKSSTFFSVFYKNNITNLLQANSGWWCESTAIRFILNKDETRCSYRPWWKCRGSFRCRCTARCGSHSTWTAAGRTAQTRHRTPSDG